jgi:transcriptional regulator with XRE-family HTH domain
MAGGASHGESMTISPQAFGQRLRLARERLGISLQTIANSTKISRSLLADLERGDVSKWPLGIYRRAFIREYAAMIGLPPDEIVSEFVELFPDEPRPAAGPKRRHADLRLGLAADPNQVLLATLKRAVVAIVELSMVLGIGWLLARLTGAGFWTVSGAVALIYYPLAAVVTTRAFAFRSPAVKPNGEVLSLRELIQLALHRRPIQGDDRGV